MPEQATMTTLRRSLTKADMERMHVPSRFWEVTPEGVPSKAVELAGAVKVYLERFDDLVPQGLGLFLTGDNGRGKTGAAVVLLMEARRRGYTGLFVEASKLKTYVIQGTEFDDQTTVWERAQVVDFLVLDDLGKGVSDSKGFGEQVLDELLRTRAANLRATVVTTNLTIPVIIQSEALKRSTLEALKETVHFVEVKGPNLRDGMAKEIREIFG